MNLRTSPIRVYVSILLACLPQATIHAQGALTNGVNHDGTISVNATNLYSLAASGGDRMALQVAKLSGGAAFTPALEVFAPDGARLGIDSGGVAARLDLQAPVSGSYSVVVRDLNRTGTGTYRLRLAQVPGAFTVPAGDEGGALINGENHQGAIDVGDLDLWTVSVGPGDRIAVQISELSGGAGFTPRIELFAPDGARLGVNSGGVAVRLDAQADAGGTYTVLVSDSSRSGTGNYELRLAQVPGTFVLPMGDEGGALIDGQNHDGSITLGDLDLWTYTASPGDRVTLQITELSGGAGFAPKIELFAPDGGWKGAAQNASAATLDTAIEVGGAYTLIVSDSNQTGAGTYRLRLTRAAIGSPGANVLTPGGTHLGTISPAGDEDLWTFTASAGEGILIRAGETAAGGLLNPELRLYDPNGVLLSSVGASAAAEVTARATNSGTFTVSVRDSNGGPRTGDYRLSLAKTGSPLAISAGDEGGALVNGTTYLATIDTGDIDGWTFTANAGENLVVRMGELTSASALTPELRLYGPEGVLLDWISAGAAAEVTARATNSGTFLVVAGDRSSGWTGTGTYRLSLAKTGSPVVTSASDEGGALVNGTTYLATIDTGETDGWTFTANAGENIFVRMGELTSGGTFTPELRLFGPEGALLDWTSPGAAAEVTARATNSGTFLVVAGDRSSGWTGGGTYRLSLAKTGGPVVISAGDEGGPLVNGTTYLATIDTGDIDGWTFTANAGENIVVRMGELTSGSTLAPELRLLGPDGVLLDWTFPGTAAEVTARATNSGTFLVVAGDRSSGWTGAGNYRLSLAKTGGPVVISAGDEGGAMTGTGVYTGTIDTGDIDTWTYNACPVDSISLNLSELVTGSTLTPWIRLYGRDGVLLRTLSGAATVQFTMPAPASGSYTVVVGDLSGGWVGVGTYRLTVNGLSDGLKFCVPIFAGGDVNITGIGGVPGATFVLLTTTNVVTPLDLWTPLLTNQFDQFGVSDVPSLFNPDEPRRFFILQRP